MDSKFEQVKATLDMAFSKAAPVNYEAEQRNYRMVARKICALFEQPQPQGAVRLMSEDGLHGVATGVNLPQPQGPEMGPEDIYADEGLKRFKEQAQPQDAALLERIADALFDEYHRGYNRLGIYPKDATHYYEQAKMQAAGCRRCQVEWPVLPVMKGRVYTVSEVEKLLECQRDADRQRCPAQGGK